MKHIISNKFKTQSYERKTIIGPRADSPESRGGEDGRRIDHPRHGKGETAGRQSRCSRSRNLGVKMEVKEGDQVLYGKYAGQEIQVDGVDYLIMKQNDILAII